MKQNVFFVSGIARSQNRMVFLLQCKRHWQNMSRTHLNAVRIRTEERGYIALYNAEQEN